MPYKVFKKDDQWCVYKIDEEDNPMGEPIGCHETEEQATEQMQALYASEKAHVTDEDREAQKRRSEKYGISIIEGGHITKPSEYADVPDDEFADPVNYAYPCNTEERTRAAIRYWGMPRNYERYSPKDRAIITKRLRKFAEKFGIEMSEEEKELSIEQNLLFLISELYKQLEGKFDNLIGCYKDYIVVAKGNRFYKVPYSGTPAEPIFSNDWIEVEPSWENKTYFKAFEDGTWCGVFTNAFQDREGEIFATVALKEFVDYVNKENLVLPLYFWHIPYEMGKAEAFALAGRMVVAAGHLNETGKEIAKWYAEHPEEPLGMSHLFVWNPALKQDGTYYWFRPQEVSFLPLVKAANLYTAWTGGQMNEKKEKLIEILGPERAEEILKAAEEATKELEELVAFKEVEPQEAAPQEEENISDALNQVFGGMLEKLNALEATVNALAKKIEAQAKELSEVKKAKEDAVKEALSKLPKIEIYRPTMDVAEKQASPAPLQDPAELLNMPLAEAIQYHQTKRGVL